MSTMMSLRQANDWLVQRGLAPSVVGDPGVAIERVHTDTRTLRPGDLFVALKGERFDAHDFLAEACRSGAVAAIAHHGLAEAGLSGLQLADSKLALGQLAAAWRAQFDLPVIAVTGSNGKTTVTQMIAAILRDWKPDSALATEGNLNNDIGLPLTLLRMRREHEVAVFELGMNHPGEIGYLSELARPTIALVNNAQREHLEFLETVEAVAHENGAVLSALDAGGIAVFPSDDAFTSVWRKQSGSRQVLTFAVPGANPSGADVTGRAEWTGEAWQVSALTPAGTIDFSLGIAGQHNVKNAFAAIACALAAGAPPSSIAGGLASFVPVKGRSRALKLAMGARSISLVDDTYNANPDSMHAAIDVLSALPGPRLLVMGDMGEVGDRGPEFHAEAGAYAHGKGIENLFTLGTLSAVAAQSFGPGRHFDSITALNAGVIGELPLLSSVLVKGSRFMAMERVIQAITEATPPKQTDNNKGKHHAA